MAELRYQLPRHCSEAAISKLKRCDTWGQHRQASAIGSPARHSKRVGRWTHIIRCTSAATDIMTPHLCSWNQAVPENRCSRDVTCALLPNRRRRSAVWLLEVAALRARQLQCSAASAWPSACTCCSISRSSSCGRSASPTILCRCQLWRASALRFEPRGSKRYAS